VKQNLKCSSSCFGTDIEEERGERVGYSGRKYCEIKKSPIPVEVMNGKCCGSELIFA